MRTWLKWSGLRSQRCESMTSYSFRESAYWLKITSLIDWVSHLIWMHKKDIMSDWILPTQFNNIPTLPQYSRFAVRNLLRNRDKFIHRVFHHLNCSKYAGSPTPCESNYFTWYLNTLVLRPTFKAWADYVMVGRLLTSSESKRNFSGTKSHAFMVQQHLNLGFGRYSGLSGYQSVQGALKE